MLALITMACIRDSSGPDDDEEMESEKLSGDDGGSSRIGLESASAEVDGSGAKLLLELGGDDGGGS